MNILLIGNGFDLAHGLPTSYNDFLDFLKLMRYFEADPHMFSQDTVTVPTVKLYQNYEAFRTFFRNPDLKEDERITEMLSLMQGNFWVEYFVNPPLGLQNDGSNWVDLEHKIADVVRFFDNSSASRRNMSQMSELLTKVNAPKMEFFVQQPQQFAYRVDKPSLAKRLYDDLERFIRCFEIYLCICQDIVEVTKALRCIPSEIDGLLSFNYTDTFERHYCYGGQRCYIHGRAKADNSVESNNMVLGMDEYLPADELEKQVDFIMFRKSCQRIFKRTDYTYKKWPDTKPKLMEIARGSWQRRWDNHLHIMGHSLDVTDKDVLKELILAPHMETTIYYHSRPSNARQIANLVRVLGPEPLNRLARGGDEEGRSIQFKELY